MGKKRTFKIGLVERHGIFRDAIKAYLEREDDFVVCFASVLPTINVDLSMTLHGIP